jgi:serine/threonine protein kinase
MLHNLGIVHKDIKLYNILWSNTLHRFVLCDFELSEPTIQHIGERTQISFGATTGYMSAEMIELSERESQIGFVDLFYNNIYALNKSI